jgi:hypothetical protein
MLKMVEQEATIIIHDLTKVSFQKFIQPMAAVEQGPTIDIEEGKGGKRNHTQLRLWVGVGKIYH